MSESKPFKVASITSSIISLSSFGSLDISYDFKAKLYLDIIKEPSLILQFFPYFLLNHPQFLPQFFLFPVLF